MKNKLYVCLLGLMLLSKAGISNETVPSDPILVGVLDFGASLAIPSLSAKSFMNSAEIPGNGLDDDENGFVDDIYGWNFAHDNGVIFSSRFGPDDEKSKLEYLKIRGEIASGTASLWEYLQYGFMKYLGNREAELAAFSNSIHGSHVSSILAANLDENVKIVQLVAHDPYRPSIRSIVEEVLKSSVSHGTHEKNTLKMILDEINRQRSLDLERLRDFISVHHIQVINVSLGDSVSDLRHLATSLNKEFFQDVLAEDDIEKMINTSLQQVCNDYSNLISSLPSVIFVVGSGNAGIDLRSELSCPASIDLENIVVVGSNDTKGVRSDFSNFGDGIVDAYVLGEVGTQGAAVPCRAAPDRVTVAASCQPRGVLISIVMG